MSEKETHSQLDPLPRSDAQEQTDQGADPTITLISALRREAETMTLIEAAGLITTLRREADQLEVYAGVPCQSENAWHARDYRRWANLIQDLVTLIGRVSPASMAPAEARQRKDHGAALLPADPSASVTTEPLPTKDIHVVK